MKKMLSLLLFLYAGAAPAQVIQQSGVVTPGHAMCWATTGVAYDCGTPGGSSVLGPITANDLVAVNGSGSLIDSGINPVTGGNWSGLQNFNGGLTASTIGVTTLTANSIAATSTLTAPTITATSIGTSTLTASTSITTASLNVTGSFNLAGLTSTGVIAAFGGTVGPYTGAQGGASGNFLSASGPAISVYSVGVSPGAVPTYAENLIQWTTLQNSTIAEAGLWINGTFSTGYTASSPATDFKCNLCISGITVGAGAGKVWNIASDLIVQSGYISTNGFAINTEFDVTNDAYDASPGPAGNIFNLFVSGSTGLFPITAQIFVSPGANGSIFSSHIGLFFNGAFSIQDQTINDSTHSTTSYQDNGTHTNGYNLAGTYSAGAINFASGTFSGNQITGKGWDVTSGGRGDFAGLTASTGAFSPFAVCAWNTNYDGLSFNNNCGLTAILGFAAGASGDNNIYALVPTGGGFVWRVNGGSVMDYGATTASTWTLAAPLTVTGIDIAAGLRSTADPGGAASTVTMSSVSSSTISSGTGTVKMSSANSANNTGWLKFYCGTAVCWVPAWVTNSP